MTLLRRADDRAARPPRGRGGGRARAPRWAPTPRSRPRRWRPSGCAAWSSRCRCSTARCSPARVAFTPLMIALSFGEPVMRAVQVGARRVPRLPWPLDFLVDTVRQDPAPGAAVLQGLFFGRIAPHRNERRTFADDDARDRPPPRPAAPVLGRRHAGRGAAERAPARGELDRRAARRARAPHRRDRRLHRRVLAAAARGQARARARAASAPWRSAARQPSARRAWPRPPSGSSPATASATQWRTWPSSTRTATCSSAVWTAETCVRMSTQ